MVSLSYPASHGDGNYCMAAIKGLDLNRVVALVPRRIDPMQQLTIDINDVDRRPHEKRLRVKGLLGLTAICEVL